MNISFLNKESIGNIYLHDCIFTGFSYDYGERKIMINCIDYYRKRKIYLTFNNIIFCSMQCCSFWGDGYRIYDSFLEENLPEMDELIEVQKKEGHEYSYLGQNICYIAFKIILNSGDTLLIICENVDYCEDVYETDGSIDM